MKFTTIFIGIAVLISISVSLTVHFNLPLFVYNGFDKALEGILLLSSISLGFYGACLSVLASIFNTKIVKEVMEDSNYRSEFILVSITSLLLGFVLVLSTIVYQVLYANGNVTFVVLNWVNTVWISLLILFLSFSILFISISFFIFFKNQDKKAGQHVNPGSITNENF